MPAESSIAVPEIVEKVKIEAPELEGPKIIGKIELAPETDDRSRGADEKRKRKRIPIEKKILKDLSLLFKKVERLPHHNVHLHRVRVLVCVQ